MDKYEYLTGEYLDYKSSAVEKAKFEYSSLGRIINRRLKKEDKKEKILKRLKIIEDKNEEQLKTIKSKTGLKSKIDLFDEDLNLQAIGLIKEFKSMLIFYRR